MKLMIASDIHGSAFYCEKMIEAYKREGADRLLLRESVWGEWTGRYNDICNAWTHLSSASSSTIEGWRYSFEWSYAYSCL